MTRSNQTTPDPSSKKIDDIDIPVTGDVAPVARKAAKALAEEDGQIEQVKGANVSEKVAMEAFMSEPVEVMILDSADPNPEPYVFLSVNGRGPLPGNVKWVPRNVPVTMKRMFVEVLARARPVSVKTVEQRMPDGTLGTRIARQSSLRYPFTVVADSKKGAAWLKGLMASR